MKEWLHEVISLLRTLVRSQQNHNDADLVPTLPERHNLGGAVLIYADKSSFSDLPNYLTSNEIHVRRNIPVHSSYS